MRFGARHWIAAGALSLAGHAALLAFAGQHEETIDLERSAGRPGEVWGMPIDSFAELVEPVDSATEVAREVANVQLTEPVRADSAPTAAVRAEAVEPPGEPASTPVQAEAADAVLPVESAPVEAVAAAAQVEPQTIREVAAAESVAATDVTVPLPPIRPPNVPRTAAPEAAPEPQQMPQAQPKREQAATQRRQAPAPRQSAPAPSGSQVGRGGRQEMEGGAAAVSDYSGRVVAHLQRHKRYPTDAARRRLGGTATLTFTLGANGSVRGTRLANGSGHAALDQEVLQMVRRASPFPPIPPAVGRSSMTFTVPVRFAPR